MSLEAFQKDMRALCDAHFDRQVAANDAWVDGITTLFADHQPAATDEPTIYASVLSSEAKRLHDRLASFERLPLERSK